MYVCLDSGRHQVCVLRLWQTSCMCVKTLADIMYVCLERFLFRHYGKKSGEKIKVYFYYQPFFSYS